MKFTMRSVRFQYPGSPAPVIENYNIELEAGSSALLIGSNGSGKSTIGKISCGLLKPASGKVLVKNKAPHRLPPKRRIEFAQFIPQRQWSYFLRRTVQEEINSSVNRSNSKVELRIKDFNLEEYLPAHPLDIPDAVAWRLSLLLGMIEAPPLLFVDEIPTTTSDLLISVLQILMSTRRRAGLITIVSAHRDITAIANNTQRISI